MNLISTSKYQIIQAFAGKIKKGRKKKKDLREGKQHQGRNLCGDFQQSLPILTASNNRQRRQTENEMMWTDQAMGLIGQSLSNRSMWQ